MRGGNLLLVAVVTPFFICFRPHLLSGEQISFAPRLDTPIGEHPSSVASGDFDHDGNTDVAATNQGSGDISVLLGNGDGMFYAENMLVLEAGIPSAVATEDMDGDGRLDLVVTSDVDSSVTIFLGNGDGTFQERSRTLVGKGPEGLVIADLDGDGNLDVATTDTFGDTISIALGNGDGTLQVSNSLPVGQGPCGLAAGDLNGDGQMDLAVTLPLEGLVVTMIGVGDGSFRIRCVGDCNQDGHVTVDELVRAVNLALGTATTACPAFDRNGNGLVTIDELVRGVNSALNGCTMDGFVAGESPAGLLVSDLSSDGIPDLAVANEASDFMSVLDGFGDGTFDTSQDFPLGKSSRALAEADFDGDGDPDLAMANTLADSVSVLAGNGDGTFVQAQSFPVHRGPSGGLSCQGLAIGDFNGDQLPDIVTANDASNDVSVLLNQTMPLP
jgi:hypothetical protein